MCMSKQHMKSPCCQGKIIRFGQRRRQCSICKNTWSIHPKKRGRKSKRTNTDLVKYYLSNGSLNLDKHAGKLGITVPALRKRIRKSLELLLAKEQWLGPPKDKEFIAVIDALLEQIFTGRRKRYYTIYFVLLRPTDSDEAIILKPVIYPRYENGTDWQRALGKIPKSVRNRILALVGDGEPSFITIARENDWPLQRCHFHLLAELYRSASRKRKSKNRKLVDKIESLVRSIITTTDNKKLNDDLGKIFKLINDSNIPVRIKTRFLKGFYRNYQLYRTYLNHPRLNLPVTSNSCETICRIVGKFLSKVHGLNTARSLIKWIEALALIRKRISCKGTNYQQN